MINLVELGRTGVKVSEIGVGTWEYKGGVGPLRKAVELGVNLIDTAEVYGTEDVVGDAIKGIRSRVFLATKVSGGHLGRNEVIRAADASLKKLGTDVIDLYQIHWPNPRVPIEETMGALEELVDQGKVRFIGVSNFYAQELKEAQRAMRKYKIVSNQVLYHLAEREIERDLLPYCQKEGITVLAYSPLARGAILKEPRFGAKKGVTTLFKVAKEIDKTPAQVALNWCLSRPGVIPIPKSNSLQRTEEDCLAGGWKLSTEHLGALDAGFG